MGAEKSYSQLLEQISALEESKAQYKVLVDNSLTGIFIVTADRYVYVNPTVEAITGYNQEEIAEMDAFGLLHPEDRPMVRRRQLNRLNKKPARDYYEVRWLRKDGRSIWVEVRAANIKHQGKDAVLVNVVDITERMIAEKALAQREEELASQTRKLEETNQALKVLLEQRENDRLEQEKTIQANVRNLVLPMLYQLKSESLTPKAQACIDVLETNLKQVTSPGTTRASVHSVRLTPKEIRIADMIKQGLSSKEIASIMEVSPAAIDFHRNNIRKKFGLVNSRTNLASFLMNMD